MSKRHKREHGRILSVDEETLGTVLTADVAAGATLLAVDDASEFEDDGTGGWLSINDQVIQYDTVDDDAGTIHLKTGLTAAADDGDPVYVWSRLYDTAATVKTALVMVTGEDDNTDPVHAVLADAVQDLPEGLRGEAGENCTLVRVSEDEWEVTAVGGRPTSSKTGGGTRFEDRDTITVLTAGAQTITLSHEPIDGSLHMIWNGLDQPRSESSVSGKVVTVPDPDGLIAVGDVIDFKYAYRVAVAPAPAGIAYGADGWRYLAVPLSDSTNRSAAGYDDSAWLIGAAPFGTAGSGSLAGWPAVSATTFAEAGWFRRHISGLPTGSAATIHVRIDNFFDLYWNGSLIQSGGVSGTTSTVTVTIPGSAITGSDALAVRAANETANASDPSYFDLELVI